MTVYGKDRFMNIIVIERAASACYGQSSSGRPVIQQSEHTIYTLALTISSHIHDMYSLLQHLLCVRWVSEWSAPIGQPAPVGSVPSIPFCVRRSKYQNLPVYTDYKSGRSQVLTKVTKVDGDVMVCASIVMGCP